MKEVVNARGHLNVLAQHLTTLEVTRETHLTLRGDCIIAVAADKAMPELSEKFKDTLRSPDTVLTITIECGGIADNVTARGHPDLILTHPTDLVIRKSSFICPRTLAVSADKASCDLDRGLVGKLVLGLPVKVTLETRE